MKKEKRKIPTLDDIAFEGRNKEYGAYYLRTRYPRYLSVSGAIGTLFILIIVSIPFLMDFFEKPIAYENLLPVVEFYSLNPPPDDELDALASAAMPAPEKEMIPEVVDTVHAEKEIVKEDLVNETEIEKKDSAEGPGGNDGSNGAGPGEDTGIYTTIDVIPRYPGGDQARNYFLRSNLRYPVAAEKAGIEGIVMVVFVIEKDGSISNITVSKGIGNGCDEEAMRVVRLMPRWEPGKRSGKAVRVLVRIPIVFRIPAKK